MSLDQAPADPQAEAGAGRLIGEGIAPLVKFLEDAFEFDETEDQMAAIDDDDLVHEADHGAREFGADGIRLTDLEPRILFRLLEAEPANAAASLSPVRRTSRIVFDSL